MPASGCSSPAIMRKSVVLPAPFGPITPTIPAGGSEKRQVLEQEPVAEALASARSASITTSPRRGPGGMWISTRSSLTLLLLGEQLLVGAEARLRLGVAGPRAHLHPFELAGERAAAGGLLLLLDGEPGLLLLEPRGVVALERDAAAAVELEDPAGDVVEEVAVVGDGDHGALVVGEEALEPVDRLGVEVVRRLVEQQQVGRGEQQAAERDAAALAAGERA